ncbi:MAG: hypothetical protein AAF612_09180 [Planctomycetota bacterium]
MYVYAGIDEAGYGPFYGPMTTGRAVFAIPEADASAPPPSLWKRLSGVVGRAGGPRGAIPVDDSKRLKTAAAGLKKLEPGCLAFAAAAGREALSVERWLEHVADIPPEDLPWYAGGSEPLPSAISPGEFAIARGMLRNACQQSELIVADLKVAVCYEDRFNRMIDATRSKAAVGFAFVSGHLDAIFQRFGAHKPRVFVDRQSGRVRYRDPLHTAFPDLVLDVLEESPERSIYRLADPSTGREMAVCFQTAAESAHLPVALASMLAKYTRELLMARFNAWFVDRLPGLAPPAGYGRDANRFRDDIAPHLSRLGVDPAELRRRA